MGTPVVTKDIKNRRLTIEKDFEAPLAKVWSAWTEAEKLARWWGPKEWPATSHAFDFREGGRWHYSMTGPDGSRHWGLLRYLSIKPQKSLHTEDFFADAAGKPASELPLSRWDVTFRKLSGSATKVVTKLNFLSEQDLQRTLEMGFQEGYTSALDNLTQLLGRAEPQTAVSKDGTRLVYEKVGSGPPVILVGGAMVTRTNPGHTELAAALAHRHTVFNYDRRGRGDSGDTAPYAVEREIEDLEALIQAAGGSAAVYGLSSGAILALKASAVLNITKLVLYEPPFIVDPSDRRPPPDSLEAVTKLVAQGRRAAAASYFMTRIFGMPAFVPWLMRLTPYWKPTVAVANTLPYDLAVTGDYSIPPEAASVKVPTLVVYGDHTQPLLRHGAHGVAKVVPGAVLKELPGENHQIAVKDLAPAVLAFL